MSALRKGILTYSCIQKQLINKRQNNKRFQADRHFSITTARNLKYVQFVSQKHPCEIRVGYLEDDHVVDINKCDRSIPSTMLGILQYDCISKVNELKHSKYEKYTESLCSVCLVAPITGMDKIMCIGLNYQDHCKIIDVVPPRVPMIFSKFASTIIGPNEPLRIRTDVTQQVDWEVELAVVIGKMCSNVKAANAYKYVFGYTIAQDITARDWQKEQNGGQFLLGKSQDTFCPIGPWIVTPIEVDNPENLDICCSVNGVIKQMGNTCNHIHKIADVIERLSSVMTLCPGDLILTGTPAGVGVNRKPQEFLQPGDVIFSQIQNIGYFVTRVEKYD